MGSSGASGSASAVAAQVTAAIAADNVLDLVTLTAQLTAAIAADNIVDQAVLTAQLAAAIVADNVVDDAKYLKVTEAPLTPFRFGGIGNGGADDTAALIATIAAVDATGGGAVAIPPDTTWKVSSTIEIPSPVQLLGYGYNSTIIQAAGMTTDLLAQSSSNGQFIDIDNLKLIGNGGAGRALKALHLFIGSRIDRLIIDGFGGGGIFIQDTDRVTVGANYIGINNCGGVGFRMLNCLRMKIGQICVEHTPLTSNGTSISFELCDSLSARMLTTEQTTAGTSGDVGIHLDSCIGTWIETVFCNGLGSNGQADAVKISNTTTPGRSARYYIGNVTSGNYVNHINDVVKGITVDVATLPGGSMVYSDNGGALGSSGGIYPLGDNQLALASVSNTGNILIRPNGSGSGTGQSSFSTLMHAIGTQINLNASPTSAVAPAAGGGGALPATPLGYVTIQIAGLNRQLPYY